ncbi:MAG: hypothetical protein F4Z51_03510 [Chloroflexi bacterium]|nr:hypothetical protein [Chloroflexota bacterium]MYD17982.1 hypothetical protein [Chloroflexota bacterium]MYJ01623.1 hypothetical protein [Chloroflexota bacterium]
MRRSGLQAFVDARYEYHWAPLLGCLVGQLDHLGAAQPNHVIGAVTGISYQPPQDADFPALLEDGLASLGVSARVTYLSHPNRLQRFRARRRIRLELRAGRAVTTHGVGVSAFGPVWGLIVGVDDERGAWRRDGPMTEQVSPWLPETEFNASPAVIVIAVRRSGEPAAERIPQVAVEAMTRSLDRARADLLDRIEVLDSSVEVEAQRYSYEAQALAANWGEAAAFWREFRHDRYTPAAQQMAVTLSRFATLFPYPMGGQPNSPGVRSAAVHILRDAVDALTTGR